MTESGGPSDIAVERIDACLAQEGSAVHMLGIGGVGMAGLAILLEETGHRVSGCDLHPGPLTTSLAERGIEVGRGHDRGHITDAIDWVVVSTAVPLDHPELEAARTAGIPIFRRGHVLARLTMNYRTIAVCGTHGKTTTATFIVQMLRTAGRRVGWCIGGKMRSGQGEGFLAGERGVPRSKACEPLPLTSACGMGGVGGDEDCESLPLTSACGMGGTGERGGESLPLTSACGMRGVGKDEACESLPLTSVCGTGGVGGDGDGESLPLASVWGMGGERECGEEGAGGELLMVVEADESDGTLAAYHPALTVVTGIEFDHAEYYTDEAMLLDCFRQVVDQTTERVIYCNEDRLATELLAGRSHAVGYSAADGPRLGVVPLGVAAGAHNYLNAIASALVGEWVGLMYEDMQRGLSARNLPARRMECVSRAGGVRVISDYAHHPSEIRAVVETVRPGTEGRLLAVFQPHRYSRTACLGADFPAAFAGVDDLVLVPVYSASEPVRSDGRVWSLYRHFRAADGVVPRLADSLERAWYYLQRAAQPGDTVLVIGAGDVERVATWAVASGGCWGADALDTPPDRPALLVPATPLGPRTTFGVGGAAGYWGRVRNPDELREVLMWCAQYSIDFRTLGGGSNILVGDCGVPGVVVRMDGVPFNMIERVEGGVEVGVAVPLARLVAKAERCGFGDFSFLEGIPGTVGGALGMNAGAHGESMSERIKVIHCLNRDGTPCIVHGHDLETGYRTGGMKGRIAIKAVLRPGARSAGESARKRAEFAARRVWMKGLQSAGSIFKNPPGDHAGRLIDEAGLKGLTIGGATVSERHGNLITARRDATASDVRALLETVRDTVEERFGVRLETEVELW